MDDYFVEDRWLLTRKVGNVVKHLRNPILVQDKPWEVGSGGAYPSVLYDEKMGKYRMWYECQNPAITIPMPVGAGLPLGLQLTANRGQDARVIRTAVKLERRLTSLASTSANVR